MLHSAKAGKFWLLLIFVGVAAIVLFRLAVRPTHYLSPDSVSYLRAADLILQTPKEEIAAPSAQETETLKQLLSVWPAGYAGCIALVAKITNTSTLLASKLVNLIFLGLVFILLYKWLGKYAWLPALYFFSFGKLEVFSYTWSEGPFLFFILLLSYLLYQDHKNQPRDPYLFLKLFLILTSIFMIRYAGLIYFFFVLVFLLYYAWKKQYFRAIQYFLALFLSSVLVILYFIKNYLHTALYTGTVRDHPGRESIGYFLELLLHGLANEFFIARNYYFSGYTDYLFLALLILQLLVFGLLLKYRKLISLPFFDDKAKMLLFAGLFYLFVTIILRKISPFDEFDFRIMAPYSTPVFIALLYSVSQQPAYFKKTYKWIIFFMVVSLLANLPKRYISGLFQTRVKNTARISSFENIPHSVKPFFNGLLNNKS